jgi:hypothetical protein
MQTEPSFSIDKAKSSNVDIDKSTNGNVKEVETKFKIQKQLSMSIEDANSEKVGIDDTDKPRDDIVELEKNSKNETTEAKLIDTKDGLDFDFDAYSKLTDNDFDTKLEMCMKHLCKFIDPVKLLDDPIAYKLLLNLNIHLISNSCVIVKTLLKRTSLVHFFVETLAYYKQMLREIVNKNKNESDIYGISNTVDTSIGHFNLAYQLILLFCNSTNLSKQFCVVFHDTNGTEAILDFLKDLDLIKSLIKFKRKNPYSLTITDIGSQFFNGLLTVFYNVSSIAGYKSMDFEKFKATATIRQLIDQFKEVELIRTLLYLIIANIVCDNEIETLPCMQSALDDIIELVKKTANLISNTTEPVKRTMIDIDPSVEVEVLKDVCVLDDGWNIVELFVALYRLAVNDKLKKSINEKLNDDLKVIIRFGNEVEVERALRLVWQLCFDESVANTYNEDNGILKHFEDLLARNDGTELARKYTRGILWSVNKKWASSMTKQKTISRVDSLANQIMISYNSLNRDLCLKIKAELAKKGFTIWIDIENIHGSSLECMGKAIESSKCILICMTENYKLRFECLNLKISICHFLL